MKINDIFLSLEGECYNAGVSTLFIRTQGCDYKCPNCDTKSSWSFKGEDITVSNVLKIVEGYLKSSTIGKISFTGGNPVLYINEIIDLIDLLHLNFDMRNICINLEHPGLNFAKYDDLSSFDKLFLQTNYVENDKRSFNWLNFFNTVTLDIKLNLLKEQSNSSEIIMSHLVQLYLYNIKFNNIFPKIIVDKDTILILKNIFDSFDAFVDRDANLNICTPMNVYVSPIWEHKLTNKVVDIIKSNTSKYLYPMLNVQLHKLIGIE